MDVWLKSFDFPFQLGKRLFDLNKFYFLFFYFGNASLQHQLPGTLSPTNIHNFFHAVFQFLQKGLD